MWPFDIFAKRRAAAEARKQAEHAAHMDRVKASIDAENRRQLARATAIDQARVYRSTAAMNAQRQASRPAAAGGTSTGLPARVSSSTSSPSDDLLNPLNPLSPLNPMNQTATYSAPADEPRHSSSHCDSSSGHSSHSSSDYGSSHSHSSHDHSCSSSSYDSSSSSSYDSGSSSSSSDW